jgi:hypothetical protein
MHTQDTLGTLLNTPIRRSRVAFSNQVSWLAALAAAAILLPSAEAAVAEVWAHRYENPGSSTDSAVGVVSDAAGNFIVTGTSADKESTAIVTIKYSGSEGSVLWQQRNTGGKDWAAATCLALDSVGNVVVSGSSGGDFYTVKYAAATGTLLWEKYYNGPGTYESDDSARAVALDENDNVIVSGFSRSADATFDYYTAKYAAANGALMWEKRYSGPSNSDNFMTALVLDRGGNVIVTGSSTGRSAATSDPSEDFYTVKYAAADGTVLWDRHYNGPGDRRDSPHAVTVDSSGNVFVTGTSQNGGSPYNHMFYTAKYAAADGALLWEKRYNGPAKVHDVPQAITVDAFGNAVVTGASSLSSGYSTYYTAKYSAADGALLWEARYNGPANGNDLPTAVTVDLSGNVIVTGSTTTAGSESIGFTYEFYTVKYSGANGALLWEKTYRGAPNSFNQANAITVDHHANVVVTGIQSSRALGGDGFNADYYTAKYASLSGNLIWETKFDAPAKYEAAGEAVAVDLNGDIVVTGLAASGGVSQGSYTAKYAAADGSLLWEKRGSGRGLHVVTDGSRNVITTGYLLGRNSNDYYTAKYAPDGTPLWEKLYNSAATDSDDRASAVALDSSGNVIVTGSSARDGFNSDFYTIKYAAADGRVVWERRFNGPANESDQANALVVDRNDNVIVIGASASKNSLTSQILSDFYATKYAAADGALLWQRRYSGLFDNQDYANAVALDKDGNVFVTGESSIGGSPTNGFISYGYYTAKYAAADGALLWEKRYAGLETHYEHANAVAVDAAGNVFVTGTLGTLKYAGEDGALLWENRPAGGSGYTLVLDLPGNVVMTGSLVQGTNVSSCIRKFAAADGSLIWEKLYDVRYFWHYGLGRHLAVGPNGTIAVTGRSNLSSPGVSDLLTIVYREGLSPLFLELLPSGARVSFTGTAGQNYIIERAPALTGPWATIDAQLAGSSGLIEYEEATQDSAARFYRAKKP